MQTLAKLQQECAAFFEKLDATASAPLVFGDGLAEKPVLMLIGEAPGEQEAVQGKPFVGKAGKNLNEFLRVLNLKRGEIYISNVVKMRPTKLSKAGRTVNRAPTREEKALFTPWLMREIAVVRPAALVTLGNVALQAFVDETIGEAHGRWLRAVVAPDGQGAFTLPLFALYHPASVIYNRSLTEVYARDLNLLAASLRKDTNADPDS